MSTEYYYTPDIFSVSIHFRTFLGDFDLIAKSPTTSSPEIIAYTIRNRRNRGVYWCEHLLWKWFLADAGWGETECLAYLRFSHGEIRQLTRNLGLAEWVDSPIKMLGGYA